MTTSTDSAASFGNSHSPNGWPGFVPQTVPPPPYHAYVDPLDTVHHNPVQMGAGGGPEGPFTSLLHIATSGMVDEFGGPAVTYGGPYPPVPTSGHHPIFGDSRHLSAPHLCFPANPEINTKPVGPNGKPKRKRIATVAQRRAANIRERRRMFNLNEAFDTLRARVPTFAYEKRLSRIETLRLAITYISFMGEVLNGKSPDDVKLNTNKGLAWQVAQEEMAVVLSSNQHMHQHSTAT